MSAGFWLRRKKMAAKKRKELLNATVVKNETVDKKVDTAVTEENTATEKPVKKAVQKNDTTRVKKS